jgi:hypothetical protein
MRLKQDIVSISCFLGRRSESVIDTRGIVLTETTVSNGQCRKPEARTESLLTRPKRRRS